MERKMTKSTLAFVLLICLGTIFEGCAAFSLQSNRWEVDKGFRGRSNNISYARFRQQPGEGDGSAIAALDPSNDQRNFSQLTARGVLRRLIHGRTQPMPVAVENSSSKTEIHNEHDGFLHAFALVATGRRIAFLFLSMGLVNFVRTTVLKIPKSDKKMFDECPWPFTLFHDPLKFVKDGATHVVVLWAFLCQVYSRFEKARAIIP